MPTLQLFTMSHRMPLPQRSREGMKGGLKFPRSRSIVLRRKTSERTVEILTIPVL